MITEDLLRALVDQLPVPTWLARADGERRHLNREGARLIGVTPEMLAGRGWISFIHPDDAPRIEERWAHSVRTGAVYDTQFKLKRTTGDYGAIRARAVPLRSAQGGITGWIGAWTELDADCSHAAELTALVEAIEATGVARVQRPADLGSPPAFDEAPGDWLVGSAPVQIGHDVLGETLVAISLPRANDPRSNHGSPAGPGDIEAHTANVRGAWRGNPDAIEMHHETRSVRYEDRSIALTPKQFAVLDYLLRRRGSIVTPDELSTVAWGHLTFGQHNFIQVQVSRVRKRLREIGLGSVIENVYGSGWIIPA